MILTRGTHRWLNKDKRVIQVNTQVVNTSTMVPFHSLSLHPPNIILHNQQSRGSFFSGSDQKDVLDQATNGVCMDDSCFFTLSLEHKGLRCFHRLGTALKIWLSVLIQYRLCVPSLRELLLWNEDYVTQKLTKPKPCRLQRVFFTWYMHLMNQEESAIWTH